MTGEKKESKEAGAVVLTEEELKRVEGGAATSQGKDGKGSKKKFDSQNF